MTTHSPDHGPHAGTSAGSDTARAVTLAELRERERHAKVALLDAERHANDTRRRSAAFEVLRTSAIVEALRTAQERAVSKDKGERHPDLHLVREYKHETDGAMLLRLGVLKADESETVLLSDAAGLPNFKIVVGDAYKTSPDFEAMTIDHEEGDPPDYFKILQEFAITKTLMREKELKEIKARNPRSDEKLDSDQEAIFKFQKARQELHDVKQSLEADEKVDFDTIKTRFLAAEASYARTLDKARGAFERFAKTVSDKMYERTSAGGKEGFTFADVMGLPEKGWKNAGDHWLLEETKALVAPYRENAHGHMESAVTGDVVHPPSWWHPFQRLDMNALLWESTQDERVLEKIHRGNVKGDPFLKHLGRGLVNIGTYSGLSVAYLMRSVWRVLAEPVLYYTERSVTWGAQKQLAGFGSWMKKYFGFGFGLDHIHTSDHFRPKPWEERGERLIPVVGTLLFGKPDNKKDKKSSHGVGHH